MHARWFNSLIYGGGSRRERERKMKIGSGDD